MTTPLKRTLAAATLATAAIASATTAAQVAVPDLDIIAPPLILELFDAKTIPGLSCQPYYGSRSAQFDHRMNGLYNRSTTYEHATCPIVRDNTTNTSGTWGVDQVYVYANKLGGTLRCSLYSYTPHGGWVASDSASTAAFGNVTLRLDVNKSVNMGFYSVHCYMPPRARIASLKWLEPLRTDRNN